MKPKVVPISKQSWLIHNVDGKSELLTKFINTFTVTKDGKSVRLSKEQLYEYYQCDIFSNINREPLKRNVKHYIDGFDIKYIKPMDASVTDGLPVFRKYASGDIFYCAGYYGVKFHSTYVPLFCPKLSTIKKYDHIGPFKTLDMFNDAITKP